MQHRHISAPAILRLVIWDLEKESAELLVRHEWFRKPLVHGDLYAALTCEDVSTKHEHAGMIAPLSMTAPLIRSVGFRYDPVGQIAAHTLPDLCQIQLICYGSVSPWSSIARNINTAIHFGYDDDGMRQAHWWICSPSWFKPTTA
ncbi:MAG: hypothetical protein C4293_16860 [Nitrospiraceae bacterium]